MDNITDIPPIVNPIEPNETEHNNPELGIGHAEVIEIIQEQIDFHKTSAEKYKSNQYRSKRHLETISNFRLIRNYVHELKSKADISSTSKKGDKPLTLALMPADLEDLPDELLEELSISSADKSEFYIASLIEEAGGIMSLDQIIVGVFRGTGEIVKRTTITAKLYRMINKGLIFSVPLKKGVYSCNEITEEEAENLFRG